MYSQWKGSCAEGLDYGIYLLLVAWKQQTVKRTDWWWGWMIQKMIAQI